MYRSYIRYLYPEHGLSNILYKYLSIMSFVRVKWLHKVYFSQHLFCSVFYEVRYSWSLLQLQIIGMWEKWNGSEVTANQGIVSVLFGGSGGGNWQKALTNCYGSRLHSRHPNWSPSLYCLQLQQCPILPIAQQLLKARAPWLSGFYGHTQTH
jgi:hypothetical protein